AGRLRSGFETPCSRRACSPFPPLRRASSPATRGLKSALNGNWRAMPALLGRFQSALGVVDGDLVLEDLLDHDFQVGHAAALDEGAGAVHELEHAPLDEGGELEAAADLVHDFITLEGFDHWAVFLRNVCA